MDSPVPITNTSTTVTATPPTPTTVDPSLFSVQYASFLRRLGAVLIDTVIILIVNGLLGVIKLGIIAGMSSQPTFIQLINSLYTLVSTIISYTYFILMTCTSGQTFGKKILNIKVVSSQTNSPPDFIHALLRETIGKWISTVFMLLGYLWVIWDKRKQAWHDKIAGTVVIKV